MEQGLYYYRPTKFATYRKFWGIAFGIYITARLNKYWWKYGHSITYRIMLLDIGHVSQTFSLAATALNFNT